MRPLLNFSCALAFALALPIAAQLPPASTELLEKLRAWELEQQAAMEKAIMAKRAGVATMLESHLQQATASGNLDEAVAIRNEIEKLSPPAPAPAPPAPDPRFPEGTVEFGGRHHKVLGPGTSWSEAKKQCEALKGRLAMPTSAEENAFLIELSKKAGFKTLWLGATDERREGKWTSEGKGITYSNWDAPGQPNNADGVEHYAVIHSMTSGLWWDFPDDVVAHPRLTGKAIPGVICQWDP